MAKRKLTAEDIETVERFERLMKSLIGDGLKSVSVSWIENFPTASVQDRFQAYSSDYTPRGLAARLQSALDKFAVAHPSEEERKKARIAELKAQLADLEPEALAA